MSKYELQVRGETVTIEFTRINDSRRIGSDGRFADSTNKNPNLFEVTAAMSCILTLPSIFCHWMPAIPETFAFKGMSFCHKGDMWRSQEGRRFALREALGDVKDGPLVGEIVLAFTAEEMRRKKVVGPARVKRLPKTHRPSMRKIVERLADAMEKIAKPATPPDKPRWGYIPKPGSLVQPLVRPADSPQPAHDAGIHTDTIHCAWCHGEIPQQTGVICNSLGLWFCSETCREARAEAVKGGYKFTAPVEPFKLWPDPTPDKPTEDQWKALGLPEDRYKETR